MFADAYVVPKAIVAVISVSIKSRRMSIRTRYGTAIELGLAARFQLTLITQRLTIRECSPQTSTPTTAANDEYF